MWLTYYSLISLTSCGDTKELWSYRYCIKILESIIGPLTLKLRKLRLRGFYHLVDMRSIREVGCGPLS